MRRVGDSALSVEFEQRMDPQINARALAVGERLRRLGRAGVRDVIEGYASVTVVFDPLRTDVDQLHQSLDDAAEQAQGAVDDRPITTLPVCYGGRHGPDLGEVAGRAGCTEDEVVALHSGTTYRVYLLGFLPGFAYLGSVEERIASPRRRSPRLRVPAGSVGIAGRQTGVYPLEAPGGWQLIGRCPIAIFDPSRPDPFLLQPGDRVRFEPVSEASHFDAAGMVGL